MRIYSNKQQNEVQCTIVYMIVLFLPCLLLMYCISSLCDRHQSSGNG